MPDHTSLSLRPIRAADRDALYVIHKAAMRLYVAQTYGWDEADQRERWKHTAHDGVQVIERYGTLAGYLEVEQHDDHIEIRNIVIAPDAQGRGIGSALIGDIIARADARQVDVLLRVHKVNPRAHALYRRLGFVDTGETETHILMARPCTPGAGS